MAKKILLADDSITIQKVVELTFSDGDYEVTAVNNGAKAIQKLTEMRPDIILSDIIMPEKNGYEVCEYVKSHPEYRNIPVILLTGTFEPFDPDRADKAGCDAVVTKPFESQSLIHKVEELIQQSQNAPAEAPEPTALFNDAPAFEPPAVAADPFTHDDDIFAAAPAAEPSFASDMPFDAPSEPAFGGETRAFPRMSFEEMQQMANEPAKTPTEPQPAMAEPVHEPETSPWDETPAAFGGETRAFPRMSFEEMEQMGAASPPASEPAWAPAADPFAEEAPAESPFAAEETPEATADTVVNSQVTDDVIPQVAADVNNQVTDVNPQITDLTEDQIDRIARRVVQLMSEQVVRNIAWEVIPDLAEMVVKERIRQLEAEA